MEEVGRMEAWYKPGKKEDKWRRCVVRVGQKPLRKEGLKTMFSNSVTKHYQKLRDPLPVEGLLAWAEVAQAFHAAHLSLRTGTVSVERLWAHLKSYMPPSARSMSKPWYNLSMLSCLAFNCLPCSVTNFEPACFTIDLLCMMPE